MPRQEVLDQGGWPEGSAPAGHPRPGCAPCAVDTPTPPFWGGWLYARPLLPSVGSEDEGGGPGQGSQGAGETDGSENAAEDFVNYWDFFPKFEQNFQRKFKKQQNRTLRHQRFFSTR